MSTKTRRPVAMATPKAPKTPSRSRHGGASKQALLDNFDLEVEHRTAQRRVELDSILGTFLANVNAEMLKIPRDMRTMTLAELEACWAGSFADTARALAEKRFARHAPETDADKVLAAAKRKRDVQSPLGSPRAKNPRTKPLPALPGKRRVKAGKRTKPTLPPATGTSTLPQHHEFDPRLPKTPKARAPRRNESFFSSNGSPVDLGLESEQGDGDGRDEDKEDDDLPDPEAMEREAEREEREGREGREAGTIRSVSHSTTASRGTVRRAPSLLFRASLAAPLNPHTADDDDNADNVEIPLPDGRTLSFNPFALSPGRIHDELDSGGLAGEEKDDVMKRVQDQAYRSITERLERWKAL